MDPEIDCESQSSETVEKIVPNVTFAQKYHTCAKKVIPRLGFHQLSKMYNVEAPNLEKTSR